MARVLFYLVVLLSVFPSLSLAQATFGSVVISRVVSVYDGDTFRVDIDHWPALVGQSAPIRVKQVDTPEIRGKCASEKALAQRAKLFTQALLLNSQQVELRNIERGKYFRILADVYIDGQSLASQLIANNLARPYQGGKRRGWCE
ncbi:thermonuclease family protein [Thalassotalea sp. LPB0316]|uniref:thermonuclease family protein n=1 Tax=Thalassotalea sp. LPB0316 TaxID=2769490 RepID=UPI001868BD69|nr:thermonuclease family protein [Thalassotalea sp. LPB0316]QOL26196.1 thermonuclease family protein [Thalassotalea sp. LPB0316]